MQYIGGMRWRHSIFWLMLWLAGCASQVPREIREAPATAVEPAQVQKAPDAWRGHQVRWGGEVIEMRNLADHSDLLVLARTLGSEGRPQADGAILGRFIARFPGFVDPEAFPPGRQLTLSGEILGVETHKVGAYPYRYPVVRPRVWHLWPEPEPRHYDHYHGPWWPGPYWGYPWGYPWGPPWWW